MRRTVIAAVSEAPCLSATLPVAGEVLELDPPCTVNDFGMVHPVRGRPWLLTRIQTDARIDEQISRLAYLHRVLGAAGPIGGVHSFFWYGTVRRDDGQNERALIEADLPRRTRSLRETSVLGLPLGVRLRLASSLAETLAAIAGLPATLGKLDADSIRLDLGGVRAVVTGLESGAFGRPYQQQVLDVGRPAGQLAPELYDGDGVHPDAADTRTDAWALAVALHRLIVGCHPYQGLPDLRPDTVAAHLAAYAWPGPRTAELDALYQVLPPAVLGLFHRVFQQGWADPAVRPVAAEWSALLDQWTGPPEFASLAVDCLLVAAGEPVTVTWATRHATHVATDSGQHLNPAGAASFTPSTTGSLRLWAVGTDESVPAETPTILVLRERPTPRLVAIDHPEPVVPSPQPRSIEFTGQPARTQVRPISRPPGVPTPSVAPWCSLRPSKFHDRGGY
ncbi:MAG TPA: hypothetical protein VFB74_05810 [Kribbellaceae bacterium]|nr:hypothetical protein [Kribbellaceae bacterium]